jgi:hypothetical protein
MRIRFPDPAPQKSDGNLQPGHHFEPLGLHSERLRLYFEPLKLLNIDFNADLNPAFKDAEYQGTVEVPNSQRISCLAALKVEFPPVTRRPGFDPRRRQT